MSFWLNLGVDDLPSLVRILLSLVLLIAGVAKVVDRDPLRNFLRHMGLSDGAAHRSVPLIALAEVGASAIVFTAPGTVAGLVAVVCFLLFGLSLFWAMRKGISDCGCFGTKKRERSVAHQQAAITSRVVGVGAGIILMATEDGGTEFSPALAMIAGVLLASLFLRPKVSNRAMKSGNRGASSPSPSTSSAVAATVPENRNASQVARRMFIRRLAVLASAGAAASFALPVRRAHACHETTPELCEFIHGVIHEAERDKKCVEDCGEGRGACYLAASDQLDACLKDCGESCMDICIERYRRQIRECNEAHSECIRGC